MTRFDKMSWLGRAALLSSIVLGAFLVLFALAEAAVRVRAYANYGSVQSVNDLFHVDPKLGIRVPNANTDAILARRDHVQINNWGFRSPDIAVKKPPNTIRIAFLGESTTFCAEATSNKTTWPALVAEKFQERYPKVHVQWINAGVSGYIVRDSLIRFQNQVRPFHPDIVVIYHGNNDLSVETRAIAIRQHIMPEQMDSDFLARHSFLIFLLEKNLQHRLFEQQGEGQSRKLASDFDLRPLADEFEKRLQQLTSAIEQSGAIPVVVTFSARVRPTQTPVEQLAAVQSNFQFMPYMTPALFLAGFKTFNEAIWRLAADPRVIVVGDEFAIPSTSADYEDAIHLRDPGMVPMADRIVKILGSDKRIETLVQAVHDAGDNCAATGHGCGNG